jgi:hypothetical protein
MFPYLLPIKNITIAMIGRRFKDFEKKRRDEKLVVFTGAELRK